MKFFFNYASSECERILNENFELLKRSQNYSHKHIWNSCSYFVVSALNV